MIPAVPCIGLYLVSYWYYAQFSEEVEEIYFLVERAWGSLVQERDCTDYHESLPYPFF